MAATQDLARLLGGFVPAALEAGAAIMEVYRRPDSGASAKADGSPVTEADVAAEAIILRHLAALAPDLPVVAEESVAAGRVPETAGAFILVDPLDGTKEFVSRNGDFTVNIALIQDARPVAGVVYAPAVGLLYTGAWGQGARRAEVTAGRAEGWRPITARTPGEALQVIASRSHMSAETQAYVQAFRVQALVSAGSSLKFCKVAEGIADLYPRLGRTMEWDTAAGDAVLRAAGGRVDTLDGSPLRYGKRNQADDVDFANPWFVAAGAFDPAALRRVTREGMERSAPPSSS